MIKLTFMGAGSTVFARNVLGDCICTDVFRGMEIALYDIDRLPINDDFLPVTDELYAGAEGWYGYSMYHFQYSDDGALVIPSPPRAK